MNKCPYTMCQLSQRYYKQYILLKAVFFNVRNNSINLSRKKTVVEIAGSITGNLIEFYICY